MPRYEYKVVPAPKKGQRAKGIRGTEGKFANALQNLMNEQGADGWEYQRTDTLPCEERSGLRGKTTVFQNMLVFRRILAEGETAPITAAVDDVDNPARTDPPLRRDERVAEVASEDAANEDGSENVQADADEAEKSAPDVVST